MPVMAHRRPGTTRGALLTCLALVALACGPPQGEITVGDDTAADQPTPDETAETRDEQRTGQGEPDPPDKGAPGQQPALEVVAQPEFTDPIEHQGRGEQVVELHVPGDEPAIAHLRHEGTTYFRATTRTDEGHTIERVVRAHGPYEGIRPLNFRGQAPATLDIGADGAWSIDIRPLHDARTAHGPIDGAGDEVILVDIDTEAIHLTHDGRSSLRVVAWGQRRLALLGAIGPYDDTLDMPAEVDAIEIVADGTWTLSPTASDDTSDP